MGSVGSAKDRIADAYAAMLRERGDEKFAVKELCCRAGVSKQTFYYHFARREDVPGHVLDRVLDGFRENLEFRPNWNKVSREGEDMVDRSSDERVILQSKGMLRHVYDNRRTFETLMRSHLGGELRRRLAKLLYEASRGLDLFYVDYEGNRHRMGRTQREFFARGSAWENNGWWEWWIDDDFDHPPDEVFDLFVASIQADRQFFVIRS